MLEDLATGDFSLELVLASSSASTFTEKLFSESSGDFFNLGDAVVAGVSWIELEMGVELKTGVSTSMDPDTGVLCFTVEVAELFRDFLSLKSNLLALGVKVRELLFTGVFGSLQAASLCFI